MLNQRVSHAAGIALFAAATAVLLLFSRESTEFAIGGLKLSALRVLPGLLPFSVAVGTASRLGLFDGFGRGFMRRFFRINGGAAALLAGFLGGYPSGAAAIGELLDRGEIDTEAANRLLLFTNNCSPSFYLAFIVPTLGLDPKDGLIMYAIHVLSALIVGFCTRFVYSDSAQSQTSAENHLCREQAGFTEAFTGAIAQSSQSMLKLAATITVFSVVSGFVSSLPVSGTPLLCGLCEMTSGISLLGKGDIASASFIASFGGASVCFQTAAVLSGRQLKLRAAFIGKALQGALAYILSAVYILLAC